LFAIKHNNRQLLENVTKLNPLEVISSPIQISNSFLINLINFRAPKIDT